MKTIWPFSLFTKALRFWRPPPVNLPTQVTACEWGYTPKPPFLILTSDGTQLLEAWKTPSLSTACEYFSTKLTMPSDIHAIIDARAMVVLAMSREHDDYSGCEIAWAELARHHEPVDVAILEVWARESMAP